MKLFTFAAIIAAVKAIDTSFSCPSGDLGACCEAYDPGDKLGYDCSSPFHLCSLTLTQYLFHLAIFKLHVRIKILTAEPQVN